MKITTPRALPGFPTTSEMFPLKMIKVSFDVILLYRNISTFDKLN